MESPDGKDGGIRRGNMFVDDAKAQKPSLEHASLAPFSFWALGYGICNIWNGLLVRCGTIDHGAINIHLLFYCCSGAIYLVILLVCLLSKRLKRKMPGAVFYLVGTFCMVVSSVLLSLPQLSGSTASAAIAVVLAAYGSCVTFVSWGFYLSSVPVRNGILYTLLSFIICFFGFPFCSLLSGWALMAALIAFPCASCVCLWRSSLDLAKQEIGYPQKVYYDRDSLKQFWKLLATVAIYAFILTIRAGFSLGYDIKDTFILFYLTALIVSVMTWSFVNKGRVFSPEGGIKAILFIFATGFFIYPFSRGMLRDLLPIIFLIATFLMIMVCVCAMVDVANHSSVHPFIIFSAWGVCYGLPRVLSIFIKLSITDYVPENVAFTYVPSFLAIYGLLIAVIFLLSKRPAGLRPIFSELMHPSAEPSDYRSIDERCGELARRYGLTTRECEIITLMCKGRTKSYIADTLFISENTVRVHTKNAYAKMGVHNRQDLLERIDVQ